MSWHVYRIFRVFALCALFCFHSILIGIISVGMLAFEAGVYEALQFSVDIIALFIIFSFSVFTYIRTDAAPNRIPNLIAFSTLLVLSFIGAVGLTARGASRSGAGLCGDFADAHPERCTKALVAMTFTWVAVMFAGGGLAASWLDRNSRMGSYSPFGRQGSMKELELPKQPYRQHYTGFHVSGPSDSYIPRPRDPYARPRKRPTRSQSHQRNRRYVPSNRAPVPPLPPLPYFDPVGLETSSEAASRIGRGQGTRRVRSTRQKELEELPDLPPPTRRPPKDPRRRETDKEKCLSYTDVYAAIG